MSTKLSARFKSIAAVVVILGLIAFLFPFSKPQFSSDKVKILSYSSFLASWGPGPELAKIFKEQSGISIEFLDADDAGLLLTKLELFPSDVVIGLDWLTVEDARRKFKWKALDGIVTTKLTKVVSYSDPHFVPFDWAPLTFIYRKGEIDPPQSIDDLLDARFKRSISLQDPRTSAPGLQFLFWLVALKGEDQAFDFLKRLRPNIRAISPSWSTAYGLFQKGEAKVVFSYLTSPSYHWVNEKDFRYQAAELQNEHIYQVELAGIPEACMNCVGAEKFLKFLRSEQAQKILMKKNVMFSVDEQLQEKSEAQFSKLPSLPLIDFRNIEPLLNKKKELIERWKDINL